MRLMHLQLVGFYDGRQKLGATDRMNYAVALDKLGRLYAKDPSTYSRAEERLTAARKIFAEQFALNEDSTLAALISLYARQNKEAELKAACDRRLNVLSRDLNNARESNALLFARMYVKAAAEVTAVYTSRNETDWADAAYAQLFAQDAKISGKLYTPEWLSQYAALLEQYRARLLATNNAAELAKVEEASKAVRARQGELQLIQQQQQADQSPQPNPAGQAPQ